MTFEEFAAARLGAVLRFAAVLTGDRAAAEDVVQEVLIRALGRWEMIARLDRPEAYIRKMIVNEWLSWRRRSWRQVPSGAGTDVDTRLTPDPAAGHAERDALLAELARLPRRQRAVLVLRYYEALSDAEIAEVLGCAPGTVRGYASRALAVARTRLDGQQAIELSETGRGMDLIEPLPTLLWVNAQTYLPMRLVSGTASTEMGVFNFSYLPATPANLALLRTPIPAGYPRSNPEGS
jgi:RNA polymerase sigma-70 factor (sigma-E family)